MSGGLIFLLFLCAAILALAGIVTFFITLAHIGETRVLLDRDRGRLVASLLLAVVGTVLAAFLLLGVPTSAWGQEVPPPGWTRAVVSTCAPYNPGSCQSRTVWLQDRAWCGKRANWWSATTGREAVTVRCGQ